MSVVKAQSVTIRVQSPVTVKTLNHLKVGATKTFVRTKSGSKFFKLVDTKYLATENELEHMIKTKQVVAL